jgi:hypothetical protein
VIITALYLYLPLYLFDTAQLKHVLYHTIAIHFLTRCGMVAVVDGRVLDLGLVVGRVLDLNLVVVVDDGREWRFDLVEPGSLVVSDNSAMNCSVDNGMRRLRGIACVPVVVVTLDSDFADDDDVDVDVDVDADADADADADVALDACTVLGVGCKLQCILCTNCRCA